MVMLKYLLRNTILTIISIAQYGPNNVINISIPKGFQSMLLAICANFENVEM